MNIRFTGIAILLIAAMLTFSGCQNTSTPTGSISQENSSFTEENTGDNKTVPMGEPHPDHVNTDYEYDIMGDTLVVKLDSNQTTGGSWTASEMVNLEETDSFYTQNDSSESMTGVGGIETHALTATTAGIGSVRLVYGQPWEGGSTFEIYDVTMTIDDELNISDVQFVKKETAENE